MGGNLKSSDAAQAAVIMPAGLRQLLLDVSDVQINNSIVINETTGGTLYYHRVRNVNTKNLDHHTAYPSPGEGRESLRNQQENREELITK